MPGQSVLARRLERGCTARRRSSGRAAGRGAAAGRGRSKHPAAHMTSWRDCRLNGAGPGVCTAPGAPCRCGCAHCCSPPSCRTAPCNAELAAAKGQALLLAAASPRAAKPRINSLCRRLQGLRGAAAAPLLLPRAESCSIAAGAAPVCCRCLLKVDGDRKRACNCGGRGGQRFYYTCPWG